jgi:regulator of replication initiation timing
MTNQDLIDALNELKTSVDSLTTAENDRFNTDTSHDDIVSLKSRISELVESNNRLRESVVHLNYAINEFARVAKRI